MHAPKSQPQVTPPVRPSSKKRLERETLLLAGFGAACALLSWLVIGALTGLGKQSSLIFPAAALVAAIGAVVALTRAAIVLWAGSAAAIAIFCVITLTPFVTTLLPTRALIRSDTLRTGSLDAVVVLSAGITPDSMLAPDGLDRLLAGLALMRDSVAPVLVVTVPRLSGGGVSAAPDQKRVRALVARPFPMLMVDSVHTTHDEAVSSWRLLRERGATRVAVVTSPFHTRRACATFEKVGFSVTCVAARSRTYSITAADNGAGRLVLFREWIYERAAWLEYRARGWVNSSAAR